MTSRREHEMAIAVAQTVLIKEMQEPGYMSLGAGVDAESFRIHYDTALEQLDGDYPDSNLD